VEFTGSGFEFDNIAIATNPGSPPGSMVFVESVLGKSVNFLPNGGTGSMPAQTEPTNTLTPLTANTFTRAGYTFAGWHTTPSGSGGTSYANEADYGFAADITLHAQWTANSLVVTYDPQGGSAIADGSTTTGASIASSPGTPTRSGYTFDGWFAASTGGTALTFPYAHGRTADFILYAQWTALTYNVTYDEQGGTTVSDDTYTTGSTITLPTAPSQAGFTFAGWFIASTGGTALGATYTPPGTGNIIIYAQWTSNTPPTPPPSSTSESPITTQPIVAPADTAPSLLAPPRVRRGSTVTVVAVGFIPGESVQIKIGDSGTQQSLIADANGKVRITVKIAPGENQSNLMAQASAGTRKANKVIQVTDVESVLPSTGNTPTSFLSALALLVLGMAMLVGARRLSARSNHSKLR
jgi:uncharacterized repeat protein (TIGR02543 family)/LPXTG-motif cell wall-anchored protein